MPDRGWKRAFDEPIPLPRGRKLVTLEDTGKYITKLPKAEHEVPEWQAAGDASAAPGREVGRADNAGADRHHASAAPPRDSRVRYRSEAPSLGKAQASEGSMTEAASMNWSREFDEPIVLPDGGELRTLLDAGRYVDALPRSMHEREEWQAVMEVLLSAVEGREPVSLLRIALTLALQESGPTRGPRR